MNCIMDGSIILPIKVSQGGPETEIEGPAERALLFDTGDIKQSRDTEIWKGGFMEFWLGR